MLIVFVPLRVTRLAYLLAVSPQSCSAGCAPTGYAAAAPPRSRRHGPAPQARRELALADPAAWPARSHHEHRDLPVRVGCDAREPCAPLTHRAAWLDHEAGCHLPVRRRRTSVA